MIRDPHIIESYILFDKTHVHFTSTRVYIIIILNIDYKGISEQNDIGIILDNCGYAIKLPANPNAAPNYRSKEGFCLPKLGQSVT